MVSSLPDETGGSPHLRFVLGRLRRFGDAAITSASPLRAEVVGGHRHRRDGPIGDVAELLWLPSFQRLSRMH
jgi:hypothetical protein